MPNEHTHQDETHPSDPPEPWGGTRHNRGYGAFRKGRDIARLARVLNSADASDPWIHGFKLVRHADRAVTGTCLFKGPPTPEGVAEIAYGVAREHRNQGYATEAAGALISFAFSDSTVCTVQAHTLPLASASTRVLARSGFRHIGEIVDPEDGLVWRWEINKEVP